MFVRVFFSDYMLSYDSSSCSTLWQHLPMSEATPIYESLVAAFPTTVCLLSDLRSQLITCQDSFVKVRSILQARYWKQYVEANMAANNDEAVRHIFSRCLMNCPNVNLW